MGWSYRKSDKFGPFRVSVSVSESGVGYSFGGGGFRTGVSASGRLYTSYGILKTGFRYHKSYGSRRSKGCFIVLLALSQFAGLALFILVLLERLVANDQ